MIFCTFFSHAFRNCSKYLVEDMIYLKTSLNMRKKDNLAITIATCFGKFYRYLNMHLFTYKTMNEAHLLIINITRAFPHIPNVIITVYNPARK